MRPIKSIVRRLIGWAVAWRLKHLRISVGDAEYWAARFKAWPAIFSSLEVQRTLELSNGTRMEVGIVDAVERTILTTGKWDEKVATILRSCLHPGNTFVDIGANVGYFTLMASEIVGDQGTVVACEPSVRALRKLSRHLWLNQTRNVFLIASAVGRQAGTNRISLATESNIGGTSIERDGKEIENWELISVRRLDDICTEMNIAPSLIKIDVEGYEFEALRGAEQTLRTFHPVVVCELTNQFLKDFGASAEQLMSFMEGLGYHCFLITETDNGYDLCPCRPAEAPGEQTEVVFSVDRSITMSL
jgi:FkbM family methyltransferase